jgi:hypothetical protein
MDSGQLGCQLFAGNFGVIVGLQLMKNMSLPAPSGDFGPFMRLYWPSEEAPSILDGTRAPPVRAAT